MNQARSFLLIAWLLVAFLAWEAWQKDYAGGGASAPIAAGTSSPAQFTPPLDALPAPEALPEALPGSGAVPAPTPGTEQTEAGRLVTVTTDVLRLVIDARGGSLVSAELLNYRQTADKDADPVVLLSRAPDRFFTAQSGIIAATAGAPAPTHQATLEFDADSYSLLEGSDTLVVPMKWRDASGLSMTKRLVLTRGSYAIDVQHELVNDSQAAWRGNAYRQLLRVPPPPPAGSQFTNPEQYSFVGAAWYNPVDKFEKLAFNDFEPAAPLGKDQRGGWTAMLQHYFFAAWIPAAEENVRVSSAVLPGGQYLIREVSPGFELAPGARVEHNARLYVGPKLQDDLADIAPGLERTVDYGIFTILSQPLFWLLSMLHGLFGNWGWAIIGLVVLIKLVFFKLSEAQYKSFAKMRAVQPRIEGLKERYGDDKQKFQMAMMELYKKEKINPMGGCLPILVQIPVFIALYWVLLESVELRHAPWILWIQNLTARDPYFVLPIINMATMYLTQLMTPMVGMDPMQKRIMQIMPLAFGFLFAFFPAGLVLYWATNGLLGLLQQWVITRRHGTQGKTPAKA
jgi:YidC/Oxa1 family membrane protein insertase